MRCLSYITYVYDANAAFAYGCLYACSGPCLPPDLVDKSHRDAYGRHFLIWPRPQPGTVPVKQFSQHAYVPKIPLSLPDRTRTRARSSRTGVEPMVQSMTRVCIQLVKQSIDLFIDLSYICPVQSVSRQLMAPSILSIANACARSVELHVI